MSRTWHPGLLALIVAGCGQAGRLASPSSIDRQVETVCEALDPRACGATAGCAITNQDCANTPQPCLARCEASRADPCNGAASTPSSCNALTNCMWEGSGDYFHPADQDHCAWRGEPVFCPDLDAPSCRMTAGCAWQWQGMAGQSCASIEARPAPP